LQGLILDLPWPSYESQYEIQLVDNAHQASWEDAKRAVIPQLRTCVLASTPASQLLSRPRRRRLQGVAQATTPIIMCA
jgi:hypothetical protein